ncbi:MAG TPA: histidine kinase [Rhodobacteraceae bacterium]|nr:histidine kinase [Paracoccaceae bacterium]
MIDWTRVRELKDEIGEEDFAEVAEMFIGEVEEVIDRLKVAPEPSRVEEDLHFIKSSALNLGFADLAALCQTGERQAAAGDTGSVDLVGVFASYTASKTTFLDG